MMRHTVKMYPLKERFGHLTVKEVSVLYREVSRLFIETARDRLNGNMMQNRLLFYYSEVISAYHRILSRVTNEYNPKIIPKIGPRLMNVFIINKKDPITTDFNQQTLNKLTICEIGEILVQLTWDSLWCFRQNVQNLKWPEEKICEKLYESSALNCIQATKSIFRITGIKGLAQYELTFDIKDNKFPLVNSINFMTVNWNKKLSLT